MRDLKRWTGGDGDAEATRLVPKVAFVAVTVTTGDALLVQCRSIPVCTGSDGGDASGDAFMLSIANGRHATHFVYLDDCVGVRC